ncbi:MAG: translation initiation factor IF-3, partial [Clostridiaceae bacterium]|nr:translation initiation factor IF-3 [Clostridiaceae bacterium]
VKEVRMNPTIEENDFNFKARNAMRFLKDGDKVKVIVRFRGREINYASIGQEMLEKFYDMVKDVGVIEKKPRLEGKNMVMIINPRSSN